MKKTLSRIATLVVFAAVVISCYEKKLEQKAVNHGTQLRAPAYPLITIDPYTSAWSTNDTLYNGVVKHWTGRPYGLIGSLKVDGQLYRFLGMDEIPKVTLVPMASDEAWEGSYVQKAPPKGWEQPAFNSKSWKKGKAAFGSSGMPSLGTSWEDDEIWVRREFKFAKSGIITGNLYLVFSHDDDMELYVNGKEVVNNGH